MKKKKQSVIWSVQSPSTDHTSYLIGTMHVKDAKAFTRITDMKSCIDACEIFATEFNFAEAEHNTSAQAMDLPDGENLLTLLGEKKYQKIRKSLLQSFDFDIAILQNGLPILSINMITEKVLSDDMQESLDLSLWRYAQQEGKIIIGIESFQEQIDILQRIPLPYQVKQLKELAKKPENFRQQILKVSQLYQKERIQKLYKISKKSIGAIRDLMLYDRNLIMAERVGRIIQEQSLCYAVGAGHLAGKKGLIRLLKKQGFLLKPIRTKKMSALHN